jgi:hypothetical protein
LRRKIGCWAVGGWNSGQVRSRDKQFSGNAVVLGANFRLPDLTPAMVFAIFNLNLQMWRALITWGGRNKRRGRAGGLYDCEVSAGSMTHDGSLNRDSTGRGGLPQLLAGAPQEIDVKSRPLHRVSVGPRRAWAVIGGR